MLGDSTLFARWDEVETSWEIVDETLAAWAGTMADFPSYAAGTWGPDAADDLMARDGRRWRRL